MDRTDSLSDVPVEGAMGNPANPPPPGLTEEEAEELRTELTKVHTTPAEIPGARQHLCGGGGASLSVSLQCLDPKLELRSFEMKCQVTDDSERFH